jgi:hypothetical protein
MSLLKSLGNAIIGALDAFGEGIEGTINNAASDLGSLQEGIEEEVNQALDSAARSLDKVNSSMEKQVKVFQGKGKR